MKDIFPGYCRKSEIELKKIWEDGIIFFDTNVLLNLYRYSDSTRRTMLSLISKFSKNMYLPHQAALEYNINRYEVIAEQEKAYKEFLKNIVQIQEDLQSTNKPPFLSKDVDKDLNSIFERVNKEVDDSINKYSGYLKDDPIYNELSELFEGRITQGFSNDELKEIYTEGEERYKSKIPPGFEDEKTKDGERKFGDLLLWKQVLSKAKELNKDVILITDERKTDWWWKIKDGRNMGPRQELVQEVKLEANVDFHMYSSERFLSYGQTFLKEQINQKALDEIQAMKKAELVELNNMRAYHRREMLQRERMINNEEKMIFQNIEEIDDKLSKIKEEAKFDFREIDLNDKDQSYFYKLRNQESVLNEEKMMLIHKLDSLRRSIKDLNSEKERAKIRNYYIHNQDENDLSSSPSSP